MEVAAAAARLRPPAASARGSLDPLPLVAVAVVDSPNSPAPVDLAVAAAAHVSLYFHTHTRSVWIPISEQSNQRTYGGYAGQCGSAASVYALWTWLCSTPVEALQYCRRGGLSSATTGRAGGSIAETSQVNP